ncbi:MAG TPA: diguanylate cyclase [Pseudomonas sp.]|nr:diguanylate cyclase [Pseudomonas sp.]
MLEHEIEVVVSSDQTWLEDVQPSPYADQLAKGFRRLRFSRPLESEYRRHRQGESSMLKRVALVFTLLIWLAFIAIDMLLIPPPYLGWILAIRLAVLGVLLGLGGLLMWGVRLSCYQPLSILGALALGLGIAVIVPIGRLYDPSYPYEGLLLASIAIYFLLGLRLIEAALCALALMLIYAGVEVLSGLPLVELTSNLLFLLCSNLIGGVGCYLLEYKSREDFLLRNLMRLLADHDSLTGLNNRRSFNRQFERLWRQALRESKSLALLLCDIDHFKAYNDRYGHQAGDVVLQRVGTLLQEAARRPLDMAVRLGGEEFAVLLYDIGEMEARHRADAMRKALETLGIEHEKSTTASVLTMSVGVACICPGEEGAFAVLYEHADRALYEAKAFGRNRVVA